MRVSCDYLKRSALKVDLLCLALFEDTRPDRQVRAIDKMLGGQLSSILKRNIFDGRKGTTRTIVPFPAQNFRELLLIGLGKREDFDLERLRQGAGLAGKKACDQDIRTVGFVMPLARIKSVNDSLTARAVVEGVNLGSYFLDRFKSGEAKRSKPARLTVYLAESARLKEAKMGAKEGLIVSDMQNHARDLVGYPSNLLTPTYLANEARRLGRRYGFKVQVYGRNQIEKFKMGAFLAVGKGSTEPMKLIRIDYQPSRRAKKKVVLVGKGITFDSGGISLKPVLNMHEMKQDMGGAAVVLCTAAAVAQLKLPLKLTVFIPACENMPSGDAYKPGDVLTTCTGKTIEVISTDAEGRLILADALGLAAKLKPDYLFDVATLTGAAIYALGYTSAIMLGTSDELIAHLREASEITGERIWQLPLWDEYEHHIESPIADMKNSGGRPAGTITATRLLKHFTGDIPWAHIDIAGMDLEFRGKQYTPKGPSGYGVRILTETLSRL